MADFPYFPFYPADFISSLRVCLLSLEQQGAYVRLLSLCWLSGDCSLPGDPLKLRTLSGLNEHLFADVQHLFVTHPQKPGFVTNARLWKEWEKALRISHERAEAGKKSGESRRTNAEHLLNKRGNKTRTKRTYSDSDSDSESSSEIEPKSPKKKSGDKRRTELERFQLTEEHQTWARQELGVVIPPDVFSEFKNYWLDLPNSKLRSDWEGTFKNRIRALVNKGVLRPQPLSAVPLVKLCAWKNEFCEEKAEPESVYCRKHGNIIRQVQGKRESVSTTS